RLRDEILNAGSGGPSHHRTIGLEPRQERDDLVELGEDQARQPAEDREESECAEMRGKSAGHDKQGAEKCGARKARKGQRRHPCVELELAAFARTEDRKYIAPV